jgi:membrane protein
MSATGGYLTLKVGRFRNIVSIPKTLFKKYRKDNGNLIVAAIAFYVLLTFIPFTLLAVSFLGYVADLTDLDEHFLAYVSNVVPAPYNVSVIRQISAALRIFDLTKNFSGPLGILALIFFTSRLFAVLIPSFHIMFGRNPDRFIRQKGKELLFTIVFAALQVVVLFITIFLLVIKSKVLSIISDHTYLDGSTVLYVFSFLDLPIIFATFCLLYYVLSPLRKRKALLLGTSLLATAMWVAGKQFFQFYVAYLARLDMFFGLYGIFIGFLFWAYYSVFVLVVCGELQSILLQGHGARGTGEA